MAIKKFLINNREWHYALVTQQDGTIAVVVTKPDGSTQSITVTDVQYSPEKGIITFVYSGRRLSMRITQQDKLHIVCPADGKAVIVKPMNRQQLQSVFLPASQEGSTIAALNLKTIKSPLAGRVTKILVCPNQVVTKGQPLLMIESMKMENEIGAPTTGSIKTISISLGDVVKPNQVLVVLE
ncbi:acetyl-CoA carboxylase biotin carboxyl carrier protein subunit [Candidatus Dependentiae bacterium]|nr:acetyl-CoA carboxylase biotin carboxyl carrier protein subunit [Candidatus Dependentiae bacterium]